MPLTQTLEEQAAFEIEEFLDAEQKKDLLRFSTAGSVDDGKSTLIGRLLYDSRNVYEDHVRSVTRTTGGGKASSSIDFALLTDGLRAEREQGITIDVAYRFFSTARRKFIIADTLGHEQYTRNMATGASTADVAIVLIDAGAFLKHGGLLPQSRRHTYIAALLGIPHLIAAVNKMDLVGYSEESFKAIRTEFLALAGQLGLKNVEMVPVSALEGDNVVAPSAAMPWYEGPTLLEYLETVPLQSGQTDGPMRFPVQLVLRPDANFRGFAGQVARGVLRAGERVVALPSRRETTVKRIVTYDGDIDAAAPPQSVTVELADEIDLSRGEMLVAADAALPEINRHFRAMVVWMHETPLVVGRTYVAKHTTRTVRATVRSIRYRMDVNTLAEVDAVQLAMNEIAEVEFETNLPLFFDAYSDNRNTGALILIDGLTNATVGAAMIVAGVEGAIDDSSRAALVLVPNRADLAKKVVEELHLLGQRAVSIDDALIPESAVAGVVRALQLAGVVAVSARTLDQATVAAIEAFAGDDLIHGEGVDDAEILRLAGVSE